MNQKMITMCCFLLLITFVSCRCVSMENKKRCFISAIMDGDIIKVKKILKNHPNPIPLLNAPSNANDIFDLPVHLASHVNQPKIVHTLIAYGAHVDATDNLGNTPLHTAAINSSCDAMKELIQCGADLEKKTKQA